MRVLDNEAAAIVVLAVAATVLGVWGAARGLLRRPGGLGLQAVAMAAFTAAAVAGLLADVRVGGLIVAAGIGAHGVWDVVHHRRDRVVTAATPSSAP